MPGDDDLRALLLAPALAPERAAALLAPFGFTDPRRADEMIERLSGRSPEERRALADLLPAVLEELARAGSPDRGLSNLVRYADAAGSRLALFREIALDRAALERAAVLLSQSQYFADILVREPRLLGWLAGEREWPARERLVREIGAEAAGLGDPERRAAALERAKRRELLAVGYRDHVLGRPFEEVARGISTLAEALVEVALALAGAPPGPPPGAFAVIALGKLGGAELNYSSDIDLIFVHEDAAPGARERYDRLARELVRTLDRLYRIDLRLRPEGARGALSRSIPAYVAYYEQHGRTWERQALLKARPIAGDAALGARFVRAVGPFIYRRYLDVAAIAEIKALKRRVEARGAAQPTRDIKEGPGGIRDIEFATQFLQLLYGAEIPDVRDPSTLGAIARLERAGCLSAEDAAAMREAYIFLRTVEHRLQTLHARQTHVLPADEAGLSDLARRLGYRTEPRAALLADLDRHGAAARSVLDRVLHGLFPEGAASEAAEIILDPDPPPEKVAKVLAAFPDPARALADLRRLATEKSRWLAASPRTRTTFASLLPRFLRAVGETADPAGTLSRFERATAMLGGKSVFYQLLAEQPSILDLFVRLASDSPFLLGLLTQNPGLFDEVVDLLLTGERVTVERVLARLATGPAAAVARSALLLVGIRDLGERANIANVSEELTALAEAILRKLAANAWGGRPVAFAVLGLGKLGGRELGYGSDLDVIFAFERQEDAEAAARAAQAIIRAAREGGLYEVDARLRPEGSKGEIAQSFAAIEAYYRSGRAAPWERLAATKLRAVAGDLAAGHSLVERVLAAVYAAPNEGLAGATREMRARLEGAATALDLKRGPGGLLDIEFATAYLRLLSRGEPREIRDPGVVPALHAAARAGLVSREAYADLLTGYQFLRKVEMRLRIVEGRAVSVLPEGPALRTLARRLGYVDTARKTAEAALLAECAFFGKRVRARFDEIVRERST